MDSTALAGTLLHALVYGSALLLFPFVALRMWHAGGRRALALTTAGALAVLILGGLAMASDLFGNRLSATRGYGEVASRLLVLLMLTLGLPMITIASVIHAMPRSQPSASQYGIAVAVSIVTWAAGVFASIHLMPLLGSPG